LENISYDLTRFSTMVVTRRGDASRTASPPTSYAKRRAGKSDDPQEDLPRAANTTQPLSAKVSIEDAIV
jgi:hypothetical protein